MEIAGKLITWIDDITIVFAFVTMIMVFKNYFQNKRQLDKIEIYLQKDNEKILLPTYVTRKNFTRSEVFGMLGALDTDSKFKIKYTSSDKFIKDIFDIQTGKDKELVIKLEENDKFDCDLI